MATPDFDAFLTKHNLLDIKPTLLANGVHSVQTLADLSDDDLKEMGLQPGWRRRIETAIRRDGPSDVTRRVSVPLTGPHRGRLSGTTDMIGVCRSG